MIIRTLISSLLSLLLLIVVVGTAAGCQPEDEVQATPSPDPDTEIPITTVSEDARAVFLDGLYAMEIGDQQTAQEHFQKAVSIDPDFTYAYVYLADVSFSPESFEKNLGKANETSSDKSEGEQLLAQIRKTYITNDAERRLELASRLTEAYPASAYAWVERGDVYNSRGEVDEAREAWKTASKHSSTLIVSNVRLSNSYTFSEPRDLDKAILFAQQAVAIQPEEAVLQVWLGDAYRGNGDLEEARRTYQKAVEVNAGYAPAHVKLGHVLSFLGSYDEARASYDQGVQQGRGVAKAQLANYRAFVALHEGNPEAAYDELSDVIVMIENMDLPVEEKTGVTFFTLNNQFLVAVHNDMIEEAEATITQRRLLSEEVEDRTVDATMKANISTDRLYWDGYLAAMSGNTEMARKAANDYYESVKDQTDPKRFENQHHLLGLAALIDGDGETAVRHLSKADPNNIGIRFQLAQAYELAGDIEASRKAYDDVARHNFNSVEYAIVRADAMKKRRV